MRCWGTGNIAGMNVDTFGQPEEPVDVKYKTFVYSTWDLFLIHTGIK